MKKILAVLLAAACMLAMFAGCKKGGNDLYVSSEREETEALVFGMDSTDGVFSPFFSTAANDSEVAGMTQLGMLTSEGANYVYGDDQACVVKDLDITYLDSQNNEISSASSAAFTRYDFLIKNGIKFSDGVDLTIKDVLFNLYVYLDPAYTGNATIYSTDIVGLDEYRTGSSQEGASEALEENATAAANERLKRISQWLVNQALLADTPNGRYEELTEEQKNQYTTAADSHAEEVQDDLAYFLPLYRKEVENNYASAMSSFEEDRKTYAYDDGEYWQSFMYMYGMIDVARDVTGTPLRDKDGRYTFNFTDDQKLGVNNYKGIKDFIDEYADEHWEAAEGADEAAKRAAAKQAGAIFYVLNATANLDENGEIEYAYTQEGLALTVQSSASTTTLLTEIRADERSKLINIAMGENKVRSISGITTSRVTSFSNREGETYDLDGEYDVLTIRINKVDPKAIWNFAFSVAPLHYYSYEGAGDEGEWNVNNNYGVIYNSTDYMNDVLKETEKLGVPVGAGAYKASQEGGLGTQTYPKANQFSRNNRIYYERNTYFDLVDGVEGGVIQNAKIKYLQYRIVNANFLLDSLQQNEIDVGTPNATSANMNRLNGIGYLTGRTVRTNGYGYVGINAGKIPDVWMRRAIMKAMNTEIISDGYYIGGLCDLIYRPISMESWAYPKGEDAGRPFAFTTDTNEYVDYAYDDAGQDILRMLDDHGYEVSGGQVLRDPDGNSIKEKKITFTVAGESNDHPAWQMFKNAEEVLEGIGFQIDVKTDPFALNKLSRGELTVWAAAWSSTIDPDMYQVYHKDSTAGSTLNWGYNEIKADKSKYSYEWGIIEELSELIDRARTFVDNAPRAQIYAEALDLIMELAVEMPTYQRNDLTVFNNTKIDSSTLNQNPTAFDGIFSKIWEVGYVRSESENG